MSITRADIELELISRVGGWLTNVGLDGATVNGTNTSLNSPIRYGIQGSGGSVVSPSLVTDADVQTVAANKLDQLYDIAELRTLDTVWSHFTLVDAKAGPVEAKSSQFAGYLKDRIAALRASIAALYGIGVVDCVTSASITHVVTW